MAIAKSASEVEVTEVLDQSSPHCDHLFKVIFIGDPGKLKGWWTLG